jgi:hypothetical protein
MNLLSLFDLGKKHRLALDQERADWTKERERFIAENSTLIAQIRMGENRLTELIVEKHAQEETIKSQATELTALWTWIKVTHRTGMGGIQGEIKKLLQHR